MQPALKWGVVQFTAYASNTSWCEHETLGWCTLQICLYETVGIADMHACDAGSRVGYHVRLDAAMTRSTRLLFCTTGILLRRLGGDLQLPEVSHIIVDEVRPLKGLS